VEGVVAEDGENGVILEGGRAVKGKGCYPGFLYLCCTHQPLEAHRAGRQLYGVTRRDGHSLRTLHHFNSLYEDQLTGGILNGVEGPAIEV